MRDCEYDEKMFKDATGRPVRKLWRLYCAHLEGKGKGKKVKEEEEIQDALEDDGVLI